jgi:predicted choloylglycine hydrolase
MHNHYSLPPFEIQDSSTSLNKSRMTNITLVMVMPNITLHSFEGTHYEIGIQQGRAVRGLIHKALEEIPKFEAIKSIKPKLLPTSLFLALAKRRATKLLKGDIFEYYPKQAQRLEGIAKGAEIDLQNLLFMQSIELLPAVRESDYRLEACTSLGVGPKRTTTEETIVAKNFDYPPDFAPYHLTCNTKPTEGYQTLGCTMAPLPGMLDGMNECGLSVTYNFPDSMDVPNNFVPLSMVLQEMLESCKTTDEAVKFLIKAKRGGQGGLLMLADAGNEIRAVEITSNHAAVRETREGHIINTNSFQTTEMQRYEIPHSAVFVDLNLKVHESSEQRFKRAQALLKGKAKMGENEIASIMRDHGEDNKPSIMTVCRHGPSREFSTTLRSMIIYPNRRAIKVLYGNPCQNEYTEFTFS